MSKIEPEDKNKKTIWITGLSAAGKSTLGRALTELLRSQGHNTIFLDGDDLRQVFVSDAENDLFLDLEGRRLLSMKYARICKILSEQGYTVVISTISLFNEIHKWNRKNLPNYFEVFLDIDLEVLRRRDPKKIYAYYDRGEIQNVAGLDLKVDFPTSPDLHISDSSLAPADIALEILEATGKKR